MISKKTKEKEFLKEKLSIETDYYIILLGWAVLFFTVLGHLYVYTTFPPSLTAYDVVSEIGLPQGIETALVKVTNDILVLGTIVSVVSIIYLLDRHLAIEKLRKMKVKVNTFTTFGKEIHTINIYAKAILIITFIIGLPWILATTGIFVSDIPLIGNLFMGKQDYKGYPSVHLGSHHGYTGFVIFSLMILVFTTAKYLYDKRLKIIAGIGASFLFVWGFYNMFQDFFTEQIVKRGLAESGFPSPQAYIESLLPIYIVGTVIIYIFVWRKLETKMK